MVVYIHMVKKGKGGRRHSDDRWRSGSLRWTFGEVEKRGEGRKRKTKMGVVLKSEPLERLKGQEIRCRPTNSTNFQTADLLWLLFLSSS